MKSEFAALAVLVAVLSSTNVVAQQRQTIACTTPPSLDQIDVNRLTIDIGQGQVCIVSKASKIAAEIFANDRDVAYEIAMENEGNDRYRAPNGDLWQVYADKVTVSDDRGVIWSGDRVDQVSAN